jgi:hypothetical protein
MRTAKPRKYLSQKEASRRIHAADRSAARDIAPIPPVKDPIRRGEARHSFRRFCELYQATVYYLPWSPDHLRMIERIEGAVLRGELCAFAMPRGSGKTSLSESAVMWATLAGHCAYSLLIGADQSAAERNLASIHATLLSNPELAGDFPEVIYPIQRLEGVHQRRLLYEGAPITYRLTRTKMILPDIRGSAAAGTAIETIGLSGHIRGRKHTMPDGRAIRPGLVLCDDPQTDESARSPTQCEHRASILAGAVLGLAGPGQSISGIMPCTVIQPGDLADRILDRTRHPEWHGERTKLVYSFPTSTKWETYAELRADSLRAGGSGAEATAYYRKHRADMDQGAAVAWPERHNLDELSAIQHAMNLRLRDELAFFAEYQNEPKIDAAYAAELTPEQIMSRTSGRPRLTAPLESTLLTGFIDCQQAALYYCLVSWTPDFTGAVVDYGTYPDQLTPYFTLDSLRRTLAKAFPAAGIEGALYAGLDALTQALMTRPILRDDGAEMRPDRLLIDANWAISTPLVYALARASPHANALMPSHGRYIGASSRPMHEWTRKPGDRRGLNWTVPAVDPRRAVRHVTFDTNFWKSFAHARLAAAIGDRGALTLFGNDPAAHRLFAEHLGAEYRVPTTGRGRAVDEWKARPDRPDNHWLDCLAGCAVAAAMHGAALPGQITPQPRRPRPTSSAAPAPAAGPYPARRPPANPIGRYSPQR